MIKMKKITIASTSLILMFGTGLISILTKKIEMFTISSPFFVISILILFGLDIHENIIINMKIHKKNIKQMIEELKQ